MGYSDWLEETISDLQWEVARLREEIDEIHAMLAARPDETRSPRAATAAEPGTSPGGNDSPREETSHISRTAIGLGRHFRSHDRPARRG